MINRIRFCSIFRVWSVILIVTFASAVWGADETDADFSKWYRDALEVFLNRQSLLNTNREEANILFSNYYIGMRTNELPLDLIQNESNTFEIRGLQYQMGFVFCPYYILEESGDMTVEHILSGLHLWYSANGKDGKALAKAERTAVYSNMYKFINDKYTMKISSIEKYPVEKVGVELGSTLRFSDLDRKLDDVSIFETKDSLVVLGSSWFQCVEVLILNKQLMQHCERVVQFLKDIEERESPSEATTNSTDMFIKASNNLLRGTIPRPAEGAPGSGQGGQTKPGGQSGPGAQGRQPPPGRGR